MKTLLFLLLLSTAALPSFSQTQDTTEVYSSLRISNDPARATWRPILTQVGSLWQLDFYNKKGIIQESIRYENKKLEVRKGLYLRYKDGKIIEKGNYESGHKHGYWTTLNLAGDTTHKVLYYHGKQITMAD